MNPTLPHGQSMVRRRTLLRGGLLGGVIATTALASACAADGSPRPPGNSTGTSTRNDTNPSPGGASSSETSARPEPGRTRVLVAYYSRAGENYQYGDRVDLEVGNTEVLAGFITSRLRELGVDHDVHRLEAADPYPEDYDATVARNVREQDSDARPALANPLASLEGYDVVLLGSPIWNVRPPMLMQTFARAHDFTGKAVHPFVTHAMSGLGNAARDYAAACAGADIGVGLAVQGETVRADGPDAARDWIDQLDLDR